MGGGAKTSRNGRRRQRERQWTAEAAETLSPKKQLRSRWHCSPRALPMKQPERGKRSAQANATPLTGKFARDRPGTHSARGALCLLHPQTAQQRAVPMRGPHLLLRQHTQPPEVVAFSGGDWHRKFAPPQTAPQRSYFLTSHAPAATDRPATSR